MSLLLRVVLTRICTAMPVRASGVRSYFSQSGSAAISSTMATLKGCFSRTARYSSKGWPVM